MEGATQTPTGAAPPAPGPKRTGSGRSSFDAVVVGGGHNGLTTAAYLARAGLASACWSGARSSAAPA